MGYMIKVPILKYIFKFALYMGSSTELMSEPVPVRIYRLVDRSDGTDIHGESLILNSFCDVVTNKTLEFIKGKINFKCAF